MTQPEPLYRVVGSQPMTGYDPLRGTIQMVRVNFVTADGHQAYVDVPRDQYTVDVVQPMIDAYVKQHQQVMGIQGPPA